MNRNLLFKLAIGAMFLTGALGIMYSVIYLLVDKPTRVKVKTAEHTLQQDVEDKERSPMVANGRTFRYDVKKTDLSLRSTPNPTAESALVFDVDAGDEQQKSRAFLPSKSSVSEAGEAEIVSETKEIILQIRELEREYEDFTAQLEEVEEQRQEIFELCRIHAKTPEKISELARKLNKPLSESERLEIVEQLRRLSDGANSRADELDEMVRETREESDAIWAQRESVHAELNVLRSLLPAETEVSHE